LKRAASTEDGAVRRSRSIAAGYTHELSAVNPGIVDLEGNQAVDTLFYNARELDERYSATTPSRAAKPLPHDRNAAHSSEAGRMLSIVADTCDDAPTRSARISWSGRHVLGEYGKPKRARSCAAGPRNASRFAHFHCAPVGSGLEPRPRSAEQHPFFMRSGRARCGLASAIGPARRIGRMGPF